MINQSIIRKFSLISLIFICNGCAGVAATGDRSALVNNPNISKTKGYVGPTSLAPNNYVTEAELLNYWGSPDKVELNEKGQKQLLYNRNEFRWNGITLMAIIPIPLVIPVGHDYVLFTVDNVNISSAYMKNNSGETGFYCWIAPLFHPGEWCRAPASIGNIESVPLHDFVASRESLIK